MELARLVEVVDRVRATARKTEKVGRLPATISRSPIRRSISRAVCLKEELVSAGG